MERASAPARFLVMSDTHDLDLSNLHKLPAVDIVLHCGDITEDGSLEGYTRAIDYLSTIKAEMKLVIAGNHDTTLDSHFTVEQGGTIETHEAALALWKSEKCRRHNIHLLDEGLHRFTISSGKTFTVYASPYTPQYGISAFQYPTKNDRYTNKSATTPKWAACNGTFASTIPNDTQIDIMMTHGPPKYILDKIKDGSSGGCEHLRRAVTRVRPDLHCFGHIHSGWGFQKVAWRSQLSKDEVEEIDADLGRTEDADDAIVRPTGFIGRNSSRKRGYATVSTQGGLARGKETLFVNAAIGNINNMPENASWVVDLVLDAQKEDSRGTTREPLELRQ